jgi:hypothetical protein
LGLKALYSSAAHLLWIDPVTSCSGEQDITTSDTAIKTTKRRMNPPCRLAMGSGPAPGAPAPAARVRRPGDSYQSVTNPVDAQITPRLTHLRLPASFGAAAINLLRLRQARGGM